MNQIIVTDIMKKVPSKHQEEAINKIALSKIGIIWLPTGTGKSLIQCLSSLNSFTSAFSWVRTLEKDENQVPDNVPVYVILSPRILLSTQLLADFHEQMHEHGKDNQYLVVHSGGVEENAALEFSRELPYRNIKSTTTPKIIKEEYLRACREKVPLIISGTYNSAHKIIESGIPVYMVHCDEAQHLVGIEFNALTKFSTEKIFFYTATLKETESNNSIGMNNTLLFGEILYVKTPIEMIKAGVTLPVRVHLVDVGIKPIGASELDQDVSAIIDAFRQHRSLVNIGAKMLVVSKGSTHLDNIVKHPKMLALMEIRPNLKIFDITSKYNPRINGKIVKRGEFLKKLQNLTDGEEAIIIHIRILTEGIDVPGITGVMLMNNMSLGDFLQTLGRASRLHKIDREKMNKTLFPGETDKFVKPYAWVIVPVYGQLGAELRTRTTTIVQGLRTYGFKASEIIMISESKGAMEPKTLEELNTIGRRGNAWLDEFIEIQHIVESKEEANALELEDFRLQESWQERNKEDDLNRFKLFHGTSIK